MRIKNKVYKWSFVNVDREFSFPDDKKRLKGEVENFSTNFISHTEIITSEITCIDTNNSLVETRTGSIYEIVNLDDNFKMWLEHNDLTMHNYHTGDILLEPDENLDISL